MAKITEKIAALPQDGNYFSLEFFPPKTQMGFSNLQVRLDRMARALRPLFVTVTWGAGGSTAGKSLALAEICQRRGLTTCLHLTCTNMNRRLVDDALEQAKALGIRNILALRGDPPRREEYGDLSSPSTGANGSGTATTNGAVEDEAEGEGFQYAIDLVKHIRRTYGDYFCIGVAAYPEGHADESHPVAQDPRLDLPHLVEKVQAGADFIMTQLFFDVDAFISFEALLRLHPSGVFASVPIIPGLMPVQSYHILRRTAKLSHAKVPPDILARLDAVKGDDAAVKNVGIDILSEIVEKIRSTTPPTTTPARPHGFHFYTLNLEKAVTQILERCKLVVEEDDDEDDNVAIEEADSTLSVDEIAKARERRRLSSVNSGPHNKVVVERVSSSGSRTLQPLEVPEDEAGVPRNKVNTRGNALAISEGEGSLGREATWDDFPNGRWGDARSPAFGEIDGYGTSLHVSRARALEIWGSPTTTTDITTLFRLHLTGHLPKLPWSEEDSLSPETSSIQSQLVRLNSRGWWTVASQPAVNGAPSSDPLVGWGPRTGGFVFQKPFVELFLPAADWALLKTRLEREEDVTYFAGDASGAFESSDEESVNPVTWGVFAGKEILTPTIVEGVSFRAWLEEAFELWGSWQRVYGVKSKSAELLRGIRGGYWLVNVIHHRFMEKEALWELLME